MKLSMVVLVIYLLIDACTNKYSGSFKQKFRNERSEAVDSTVISQREYLRQSAFCRCLVWGNLPDSIMKNDYSQSLYYNLSLYSDSVFKEIDDLARKKAMQIEPSQLDDLKGKRAVFFECADFYRSRELDSSIKSFDRLIFTGQ